MRRGFSLCSLGKNLKWFKHYTDSLDDPFIHALMDEFSHLGYAVWFGLIEIIAKENGNNITGKLSISPTYLRRKLRTSQTKLREVFEYCQSNLRLSVTFSANKWDFDFPKIAQIKDNYTKDLQGAGKKPSKHKEVYKEEKDTKEKRKKKNPPISPQGEYFDRFWESYPKKKSKGAAKKVWDKISPSEQLLETMISTIERAKTSIDWTKKAPDGGNYIPHPATWLNAQGWEDEYDPAESTVTICTAKEPAPRDAQGWRHPDTVPKQWKGEDVVCCVYCKKIIY